ncbi:MAG: thioredoxin family protein [Candidatus Nanopelagicales bacterium]|jgi:small redox-active disulfide protein 2|nr:thioredoxin family protein [Candidatus Nanopelagicales bacterium]MCU0298093.1 thioredoxin family protein [Candidatus Nanopelagicales bacterium]
MKIKILGPGCANCARLEQRTQEAISELGVEADFEKVTDPAEIASYGIMRTPGLVVDDRVLVSGRVPSTREIGELLQKA